jgi:hypothetical protein
MSIEGQKQTVTFPVFAMSVGNVRETPACHVAWKIGTLGVLHSTFELTNRQSSVTET